MGALHEKAHHQDAAVQEATSPDFPPTCWSHTCVYVHTHTHTHTHTISSLDLKSAFLRTTHIGQHCQQGRPQHLRSVALGIRAARELTQGARTHGGGEQAELCADVTVQAAPQPLATGPGPQGTTRRRSLPG